MRLFIKTVCGLTCKSQPLTTIECYFVFICMAIVLAQRPNLNSIAWISFVGAITAVLYCILLWAIPLSKSRPIGISYYSVKPKLDIAGVFDTFAALGIIAFAFRGHKLVLEIRATLPSSENYPSHVPMMRAVNFAYLVIAFCVLPLAVAG
ncbi:hypothetical protein IFM89_011175 [Coptis chinensis]|uniref:Amino acid transporter transmembrane domain-containing protein n=1 Tax=Coptis chinensis TaxID=261450 RepID=A0A835HV58_9MAGN|nr:hypothetical protein IFM89_011175 [Coptis chinensis]